MPRPLVVLFLLVLIPLAGFSQWQPQTSPTTFEINDILFLTDNLGFLGTDNSIYKTIDGGQTWTSPQYPGGTTDLEILSSSYIYDIHFFNQNNGLMVGSGFFNGFNVIARTSDGGNTWQLVYNQGVTGEIVTRTPLTSVAFRDDNVGYAVGGNGVILTTSNSGDSWTPMASPTTRDLRKVLFLDNQTGFISGDKVLLKTTNGGTTWTPVTMLFDVNDLHFFSPSSGLATTTEGKILITSDGGLNWNEHPIDFEAKLGKIVFKDETGYVVGYEGLFNKFLLKTTDGGQGWEHQFPDAVYNLRGITLTPGGKGWVGGLYGKLFSTTNGGGNSYPIASFRSSSAFCADKTYDFNNNGPANGYTYEWRVDGVLKSNSYNFSTSFTEGSHVVELTAINDQFTGTSQQSIYVEAAVGFSKSLDLSTSSGVCEGSATTITVEEPEYGSYKLYNGANLVAEDNDYLNGVVLQTPALQTLTKFRVTATRSNSCETVEIYQDVTVNVYSDLTQGSNVQLVQNYFCNSGTPVVQIMSSRNYVLYELYTDSKLVSSAIGNGQTITLNAQLIQDTTQFRVKASVVGGSCERWFSDVLEVNVEKVNAGFHLSTMNAAIGEPVNVYNKSKGAINFQWTFPNASPASSNVSSPGSVVFNQAGTQEVTLTAISASGCQHVKSKSIYVYDDSFLDLSCWATGIGYNVEVVPTDQELTTLTTLPNGDILTSGIYTGEAEFDSKAGPDFKTKNRIFTTNFLAKYSGKGVLKWVLNTSSYRVENSTNPMMGQKAVAGSDGSIYLLTSDGSFEPVFNSTDGDSLQPYQDVYIYPASQQYLIKYSSDGILQWVKSKFEITGEMLSTHFINLELDALGNLYVVNEDLYKISSADGNVLSTVQAFDPQLLNVHLQNVDFKLASNGSFYTIDRGVSNYITIKKHSEAGALEWENNIDCTYCPYGGSTVSTSGELVLFGTSSTTTEFESQGESDRVLNPKSLFVVKYDGNGKIAWLNTALSDGTISGSSIAMNEAGETSLAVKGGNAPFGNVLQSQDALNFVFMTDDSPYIVKFDAGGNIIGTNKVYGENQPFLVGVKLFTRDDQTYATGWVPKTGAPWTINGDVIYDQYPNSMFVAKFQNDCTASSTPSITGNVVDIAPGSLICPGTTFSVSYDVAPGIQLEEDNKFTVFLVSQNGSGVVEAGSLSSTVLQGTIQASIPDDIPSGITYKIRVFASNPKLYSDVIDNQFTIRAVEPPDFTYTKTQDLTYRLTPTAIVGPTVECKWLAEGNTINERTPLYKFSTTGLFEVCLVAKDECGVERTVCKNVYVECSPVPTDYTYTVNDKTVTFTGITNPSNAFEWDFRDGTTASTINAVHTFASYGTKSVCFKSSTECNYGMACKSITLTCAQGNLAFTFVTAEKTVQFANSSDADYTQFEWSFGDGSTSTEKNPMHAYTEPGTYYVTVTSTGKCGQLKTLSQNVTVQCDIPTADFQSSISGLEVTFDNLSLNVGQHEWTFGDGSTSNMITPQHTYATAGNYQVCLTVKNSCTQRTICKNISVTYLIPASPSGLVATTQGRFSIALNWIDNSTTEQFFKVIYRETEGGPFQTLAVLPSDVTAYTASSLMCDRSYSFKVIAVGQGNVESASNESTAPTEGLEKPVVIATAYDACVGQLIELSAPDGFPAYAWSTGETTQKISVTMSGEFSVTVKDNTCQSLLSDKAVINFENLPDADVRVFENRIRAMAAVDHYQWYLNDILLDGSNSQEIIPTVSGNYKVELTNNGCSSMSEFITFVITGIEESLERQINFYPLPADEKLTIVFDDISLERNSAGISLVSATGTISLNARKSPGEKKVELDVSRLHAGMYVCLIEAGERIIHKKVIIY